MKVKLYTLPNCGFCKKTKEFFKENDVEFEEINVAEDQDAQAEMVEKSGQLGTPVTLVDDKVIVGWDKKALTEALGL